VPWYFYIALKQLFPTGRRFHFFTVISTAGVMLGVALLLIVQSVMNGFGHEIRSRIVDTNAHIRVEGGMILRDWEPTLEEIAADPAVAIASPYAHGVVMAQKDNIPAFPMIRSIGLDPEQEAIPVESYLRSGNLDLLDDDSVFLSSGLAYTLGARTGSVIEVYSPLMLERLKRDELLLPRELAVAGIFESGWQQVDDNTMLVTLRLMQDLYGLHNGIHGIAIRLHPGHDADTVAERLNRQLPLPYTARSWMDTNHDFLFILQLEKHVLFFLMLFIVVVAAFSITSSLLITVVRKTREIGLFGALGGRPREIAACFCFQGFLLGCAGTGLGVGLALIILHYRNGIVSTFARITQSEDALRRFYQFVDLPVRYELRDFVVIVTSGIIISTLAGLIPAWRASRLKPTEAFRSE